MTGERKFIQINRKLRAIPHNLCASVYATSTGVEVQIFVRVHKFDAGGLTPGKENLCAMTENMQADDV
ncbi:MAG: hypothetical protein IKP47_08380, partial [Ruminococcus sp.]|nr:hypothetical protein [Ruminococcus sp.]